MAKRPGTIAALPNEDDQAQSFARQRRQRLATIAEDYCELIGDLIASAGEARAVDIARRFGVSHATVVNNVGRLRRAGFVDSQPYRSIFLTERGQVLADASRRRHGIVLNFLLALGIEPRIAQEDAEGIEHHVSETTLTALERFTAARGMPR